MIVLLDNGHGVDTQGKRSPDGKLLEYAWTREITGRIKARLDTDGYPSCLLVPEVYDVPLHVRCQRANNYPPKDTLLVSVHCNAMGNGRHWLGARGWEVHVSLNASERSRTLAKMLFACAKERGLLGNRHVEKCCYKTQSLAICRDTLCPAVLTENLFQDNQKDCAFLLSEEGKEMIVDLHVEGIEKFIDSLK